MVKTKNFKLEKGSKLKLREYLELILIFGEMQGQKW